MSTPPPLPPPFASGTAGAGETGMPGSVQALASLLGIPLENACATQPPHDNASNALAQLLQLVQQREAQQAAAAPAAPPPQEQVWQQQAWQPPAAPQHEALLAALLQSAAQQQQQPPAPLAYPQPSPQQGFAPPLLSQLVQQPQAPQALAAPPLPAFQPQEGHSQPSAREGAAGGVAAGRKVRVSCNEVPGVLHIDSLYVACECRECEGRVRMGHDRPIFGLSRWEKHCGSKAKKWRISLRVVPGSCPEVKASDPPMAVGTWLDLKGIHVSGSGERIGMDVEATFAGIAAKRARLPTWGGEGSYEQAGGLEQGGSPGGVAAPPEADANEAQEPWELALLDDAPPGGSMSEAFLRQQQQVFAELRASGSGAGTAQRQHAAIFGLAAALLEGPAQHLLSESYLPYVNDLPAEHLARQTSTFGCYLDLLAQGMEWQAVHRQLMAFMRGTLRRILSRRGHGGEPAADGEGGTAAEGTKATASSPARPTTAPGAVAPERDRGLPASGSTPRMAEAAAYAGDQAPVGSSSRGTDSVGKRLRLEQPAPTAEIKQEPEHAGGLEAGAAGGAGWPEAGAARGRAAASGAAAQDAVAANGGLAAAEGPAAAGPAAAPGAQAAEAAGSSGPAGAAATAVPPEPAAAPTAAGGHGQATAAEPLATNPE